MAARLVLPFQDADPADVDLLGGKGGAGADGARRAAGARGLHRARLQIRATVTLLAPRALPRTAYKTPLVHVREAATS